MKIAVLISGEYRTFDICRKNMTFLDDPRVDIFISTWNKSIYKNPIVSLDDTQYITEEEIRETLQKEATIEIEDPSILTVAKYNTQLIHRWKRGFELIKNSGVEYDYIVVTRPDLMFNDKIQISFDNIEQYSAVLGVAWTNSLELGRLADVFMVGKASTVISIFEKLNLEDWIQDLVEPDWHKWWYNFVISQTPVVNTPEFNDFIFCRYWAKPHHSYLEILKIQNDWRDTNLLSQIQTMPRNVMVKVWNEQIVTEAEMKWKSGYFKKYLPKKSVLFLCGRLNHLEKTLQNTNFLQAFPKMTTDIIILVIRPNN